MKLARRIYQEDSPYALEVEPGERFDILFNPDGVNALEGHNVRRALTVETVILPRGRLALRFMFNDGLLHREILPDAYPAALMACDSFGIQRIEFTLNAEAPKINLVLEKISLPNLLRLASAEESGNG